MRAQRGQASVELCALVPVLLVLALGGLRGAQIVRAAIRGEHAIARAQAAQLAGLDPQVAAETALPGALVDVRHGEIDLRVPVAPRGLPYATVHLHRRLSP